ncbi:hypothetical protein [Pedobacter sp. BMA]|uniref:YobI family P-loop NTPase n=1 Tax=Pedobacter sp. BMA TaxID=1663685 RepID=UPI000AF419DB|nr:hypothetical protein [Pedobacter sp. BMA]
MNKLLLDLSIKVNNWLSRKIDFVQRAQLIEQEDKSDIYHSLSPIGDAYADQYLDALKWALDNRKEKAIYNIALTGPYGSGKSSILKTFKQANTNKDYVFLDISLATFKEENAEVKDTPGGVEPAGSDKKDKTSDDILRLIELSILQQIFYHEEDSKIPDSRFKKIKSFNRKALFYITAGLIFAIAFGFNLFYPERFYSLLLLELPATGKKIFHWVSLAGFIAAMTVAIFRSVKIFYSLRISKVKFQEAEIEIDKGISKSILNNHLDEILYFFEVTPYSVVIIEDLDRFRQSEIFTKLRELNLLINNSKKIKNKQVVFIYAVRDEMFQNKDRTKFFDFIIPVIPVINSSNSNDKLAAIVEKNDYKISKDLIDDVSLFIDDMRLLYNVMNEYAIYSGLLDAALDRDKLLAILVYKNLWPDDFVLLGNNEGELYRLLHQRSNYVISSIAKLDNKIKSNKDTINGLQKTMMRSADEVRLLYTAHFASKVDNFGHFEFKGKDYSIQDAADEEAFEYFKKGNFRYYVFNFYSNPYWHRRDALANFSFDDFQYEVDEETSFEERLSLAEGIFSSKEEQLKVENDLLEKQKSVIRQASLKEILSNSANHGLLESKEKKGLLLSILLRAGYIDEDYLDYISLFYEGSITKNDRAFVLNAKSQISSDYQSQINKFENVIKKFRPNEFANQYLLNFSLLDFMLSSEGYENHLDHLFSQLNDANEYGVSFLDGYVETGEQIALFIHRMVKAWPGVLGFLVGQSGFPREKIENYFVLILTYADVADLKDVKIKSQLLKMIDKRKNFLSIIPDIAQLKNIITGLSIMFTDVILEDSPEELVALIIDQRHYKLNDIMVKRVAKTDDSFDLPNYEQRNYFAIQQSKITALKAYVENKIDQYISELYLALPNNEYEEEEELLLLLNNPKITPEQCERIILKCQQPISTLTDVNFPALDKALFKAKKIAINWNNVTDYFVRHGFDRILLEYLNESEIFQALTLQKINIKDPHIEIESLSTFMLTLVNQADLSEEAYGHLIKSIPYHYDMEEIDDLGKEKMKLLVENEMVAPSQENFHQLQTHYPTLQHIFLDHYVPDFMDAFSEYNLNGSDIAHILQSENFNAEQRLEVIKNSSEELILKSSNALSAIRNVMFSDHPLDISKALMIAVLQRDFNINQRVKLFNMYYTHFGSEDTIPIFHTFPAPFDKIGKRHTTLVIEQTSENIFLAVNLKSRGMISSQKPDKNGIKISNFKWKS